MLRRYVQITLAVLIIGRLLYSSSLPGEYYQYAYESHSSGSRHEGMAGIGYSSNASLNSLSKNPSMLSVISKNYERISLEYGASPLIYSILPMVVFPQNINLVVKPKNERSGWFGYQVRNLSVTSDEEFKQTTWDPTTQSIVETDKTFRDNHNAFLIKVGYGTIIPPKEKRIHSIGVSLQAGWFKDANFGDPVNSFKFNFDVGYNLYIAKIFGLSFCFNDIPIGKVINVSRENDVNYKIGMTCSFSLDTKLKENYQEENLNFSIEKYFKYYPENFISENKYYDTVVYDLMEEVKFHELVLGLGYEFLIKNKVIIRNGLGFNFRNSALKNSYVPIGLGYKINEHLEINCFYKRIRYYIGSSNSYKDPQFGISISVIGLGKKLKNGL